MQQDFNGPACNILAQHIPIQIDPSTHGTFSSIGSILIFFNFFNLPML